MKKSEYGFLKTAGRILNAGQARTIILTGNTHDLFRLDTEDKTSYVPLVNLLTAKWNVQDVILVVYELNGPIRFVNGADRDTMRDAWLKWKTGMDADSLAVKVMLSADKTRAELEMMGKTFDSNLKSAVGSPTVALELLRQMCMCSRTIMNGRPILREKLVIIIEAADMLIPEGEISRLNDTDRRRVNICQDWFSDPEFMEGGDAVVMLCESRSLLNHRIARLPQAIEVVAPAPNEAQRSEFIAWFAKKQPKEKKLRTWGSRAELAGLTAGLSVHAMMQLLKGACHEGRKLSITDVVSKVEEYIQSQLGDDIVEFKKPGHGLQDVVGFSGLKNFLREELIPRFRASGPESLPGAAVCGPIGSGKTFIFEAVAGELDMVVLVLKNIRSQWFGQTDVIFERLKRTLEALAKVLIFIDEADTQFGGVGAETHSTERRLTGKIQAMMSDTQLRGRVVWLLMTARIHLLSPDIRRPGRVGDLIIPVLDPDGKDREDFLDWVLKPVMEKLPSGEEKNRLNEATGNISAAGFASLRSELKARVAINGRKLTSEEVFEIINDCIPPAIGETRRYQTLQALVNCTRRQLLPDPSAGAKERNEWETEIRSMEARGIH